MTYEHTDALLPDNTVLLHQTFHKATANDLHAVTSAALRLCDLFLATFIPRTWIYVDRSTEDTLQVLVLLWRTTKY